MSVAGLASRMFLRTCALPFALAMPGSPALAQDDPAAELDVLSQQSATSTGGMVLARSQGDNGDLLGALATIDRVLIAEPAAKPALLLRAQLLCRIDDRQGGTAQLARLKKRDFARADWTRANEACAKPKPEPASPSSASASPPPTQRNRRWPPPGF